MEWRKPKKISAQQKAHRAGKIKKDVKLSLVFIEAQIQTQAYFEAWEETWALEHILKNWENMNLLKILMQNVDLRKEKNSQ